MEKFSTCIKKFLTSFLKLPTYNNLWITEGCRGCIFDAFDEIKTTITKNKVIAKLDKKICRNYFFNTINIILYTDDFILFTREKEDRYLNEHRQAYDIFLKEFSKWWKVFSYVKHGSEIRAQLFNLIIFDIFYYSYKFIQKVIFACKTSF